MKKIDTKNYISYARNNCRLCLSKEIEIAVNMGKSPISEKYVKKDNLENIIPKVSLNLYFCKKCSHVQLLDVVNPDFLGAFIQQNHNISGQDGEKLASECKAISAFPKSTDFIFLFLNIFVLLAASLAYLYVNKSVKEVNLFGIILNPLKIITPFFSNIFIIFFSFKRILCIYLL